MKKQVSNNSIFLFYILATITLPIGFFIRLLYSQNLSLEEFGLIYALIGFFSFIIVFVRLGSGFSLKYSISQCLVKRNYKNIRKIIYAHFTIEFLVLIITSIIVFLFSSFLSENYFQFENSQPLIVLFILYFIGASTLLSLSEIFSAFKNPILTQMTNLLQLISILVFSILIWFIGTNNLLYYFSLAWSLFTILLSIILFLILLFKYDFLLQKIEIDKYILVKHIKKSISLFPATMGSIIINKTDIIVITFFLGVEAVGIYSNVITIVILFSGFLVSFNTILMPIITQLYESKKIIQISNILTFIYSLFITLLLPISLVFSLYSDLILATLFGKEFIVGSSILLLLGLFLIVRTIMVLNLSILAGLGLATKISKIVLSVAIFNLIGSLVLINYIGLLGVAIPTVISWSLIFIFTLYEIKKEIKFQISVNKIIKILFLGVFFSLSVIFLNKIILIFNPIFSSFLVLLLSYVLYLYLANLWNVYSILDIINILPEKIKPISKNFYGKHLKSFFK